MQFYENQKFYFMKRKKYKENQQMYSTEKIFFVTRYTTLRHINVKKGTKYETGQSSR